MNNLDFSFFLYFYITKFYIKIYYRLDYWADFR